ncbi:Nif3-like dinuclear metal center hexameric protein [Desulfococcaceae bacterium HSG7]|nr:Nif3-like dinuclear metal center hexameric protein [Desulfococcaceae bacterium HSG7]
MIATTADIIDVMETIAPSRLSEKWDNVGLQTGKLSWPVKRLRVALDPLTTIVNEACNDNIDLLITHHPLIFKPLSKIDFDTPVGRIIRMAARHRLAIFAAHTNLDSARDGLNNLLAHRIGLKNLSVFVQTARLEPQSDQGAVPNEGLGRIGTTDTAIELATMAAKIKTELNLEHIKYAGNPHLIVNKIAVCTGSGSGLMSQFLESDAQVFISGDLRYHDARDAEANRRGLIDISHFASEHLIVAVLQEKLENILVSKGYDISIDISFSEKEPFVSIY